MPIPAMAAMASPTAIGTAPKPVRIMAPRRRNRPPNDTTAPLTRLNAPERPPILAMKLLSSLKSKAILMAGPISLSAMFSDPSAGARTISPAAKGFMLSGTWSNMPLRRSVKSIASATTVLMAGASAAPMFLPSSYMLFCRTMNCEFRVWANLAYSSSSAVPLSASPLASRTFCLNRSSWAAAVPSTLMLSSP